MVSRKQHVVIVRRISRAAAIAALSALTVVSWAQANGKKFYQDDPLWKDPAPRPVAKVEVQKIDDIYDFVENTIVTPRREGKAAKAATRPAQNVNTLGEVPDSAWYNNRQKLGRMSLKELQRGPGNATPPGTDGCWKIIGAKSDGVTPGFIIEDGLQHKYVLKFDPPMYPELSSAADLIGSKAFYALGYNTPENYIVHFRREKLEIAEGVMWRDPSGKKHPLTETALDDLLKPQPRDNGGAFRALASRWIEGDTMGPFFYRGTRSDDPNDTVAHEERRELRGLAVFAAWLNHHDTRAINSMDSLVTEDGVRYLKHYLMDFGSILGSAGVRPKAPWLGHQYVVSPNQSTAVQMVTLGFYPPRWARSNYPKITGVGLFDWESFKPFSWKSNYPNPAFVMMDRDDAFWAAKQVAAFTDGEIRALVDTGEYSDPLATAWITECLIKRRDKIAEAWFSKVLPLDGFRVTDGSLAFDDLGARRGIAVSRMYDVRWSTFDNRQPTPLPEARGPKVPALDSRAEFLAAIISCAGSTDGACANPVTVYLRPAGSGFEVVGIDR